MTSLCQCDATECQREAGAVCVKELPRNDPRSPYFTDYDMRGEPMELTERDKRAMAEVIHALYESKS